MANILYLIGAGASFNALPIIREVRDDKTNNLIKKSLIDEMNAFINHLSEFDEFKQYINLCIEARDFSTPDTFAKFLYITNRNSDYRKFKTILSAFIFYKERIAREESNECLDKRVLSFLTMLSKNDGTFPKNVKIISWNYDSQFLLAKDLANSRAEHAPFLSNFKSHPLNKDETSDKNTITMLHLNGIAGYAFNRRFGKIQYKYLHPEKGFLDIKQIFKEKGLGLNLMVKDLIAIFSDPNEGLLISFAWEKCIVDTNREYYYSEERIEYARALARANDILVVIGYSFPFFNREVDKIIFDEMPNLSKIYFQDPYLDGSFLYSRFGLNRDRVKIEHIKQVSDYYVPFELEAL
jgi:hypothetical protein